VNRRGISIKRGPPTAVSFTVGIFGNKTRHRCSFRWVVMHSFLRFPPAEIHRKTGENYNAMWIAKFGYILPTDSIIIKKAYSEICRKIIYLLALERQGNPYFHVFQDLWQEAVIQSRVLKLYHEGLKLFSLSDYYIHSTLSSIFYFFNYVQNFP